MVMTKGGASMPDGNTPNAGGADMEPQAAMYDVPNAGGSVVPDGDGDADGYGAPTPHAAVAAEEPYMAPAGDGSMQPTGGVSHAGWNAMENGLGMPTKTPNKK
jgi:hypothetical protein